MKTYACNAAIIASSPTIATIKIKGTKEINIFFFEIKKVKFANIANKVCPAIKLANNRIPKLNGLEKYDIISIPIKNGFKIFGAPDGIKVLIKDIFWISIPTNTIEIKNEKLSVNAIVTWLVNVKLYKDIPTKLAINMNKNKVNIKGK